MMKWKNKIIANSLLTITLTLLLGACASQPQQGGTAWRVGSFDSNGERIYFTATSNDGTNITYTGRPSTGMMMGGGSLSCASCHGPDGRGGVHTMAGMRTMTAKDIRWSALQSEFDTEKFRLAVTNGQDPNGTTLNTDMPRWNISNENLADLIAYLKTLP